MAAFESQLEAVELLIEFGADLDSRDNDGHTAVQLAINCRKHPRIKQDPSTAVAPTPPSSTSAYEVEEDIEKAREQIIELLEAQMGRTQKVGKCPFHSRSLHICHKE